MYAYSLLIISLNILMQVKMSISYIKAVLFSLPFKWQQKKVLSKLSLVKMYTLSSWCRWKMEKNNSLSTLNRAVTYTYTLIAVQSSLLKASQLIGFFSFSDFHLSITICNRLCCHFLNYSHFTWRWWVCREIDWLLEKKTSI